mmetsp:Transcript_23397/g.53993  ORF Transcript_23397/g.53993 Transcript_23397/m.53993 type:complete len:556 (-) Transcript_23397:3-1670(-)
MLHFSIAWAFAGVALRAASADPVPSLISWLQQGGAEINKLVVETRDGYRGVFAAGDIKEGDVLLRVPYHRIFTKAVVGQHAAQHCGDSSALDGNEPSMIAAGILFERRLGAESAWYHMIQALPESFDMPIWWPEVDLELLRGSGMHQAVVETKQRVLRRYHEITARCAAFGEMFTQEAWFWAISATHSRVYGGYSTKYGDSQKRTMVMMTPLADMRNHHHDRNTDWNFTDENEMFEVKARRDISFGSEVLDSYGTRSNTKMLEIYGFIPQDNQPLRALLRVPLCMPPSLLQWEDDEEEATQLRKQLFQLQPLPPCCLSSKEEGDEDADARCFRERLDANSELESMVVELGRPAYASAETETTQLARAVAHFRMLALRSDDVLECVSADVAKSVRTARSFGEWIMDPKRRPGAHLLPMTFKSEVEALTLLRSLIKARLRQLQLQEPRRVSSVTLLQRYLESEVDMLRWHLDLLEFVLPLYDITDKDRLASRICELVNDDTKQGAVQEYATFIDSSLAVLAFVAFPERGLKCTVLQATYNLTESCRRSKVGSSAAEL